MSKYFYCLLSFLIFYNPCLSGQDTASSFEKAVLAALDSSNYYTYDEFFGANTYDSLDVEDQYKFAEAARTLGAYGIAEVGYRRTIALDSLDNKAYIPQAIYWLGAMKKLQGKYAEALPHFDQFMESPPPVNNQLLELAKKDKADCQFAVERMKDTDAHYEIRHLDETINSKYSDFAPLLVGDQLYYSSLKYEITNEKIEPPRLFAKTLVADGFMEAEPIADFNTENQSTAHVALSQDGQRIYFTQCQYQGKTRLLNCALYYRDKNKDSTWGEAQRLPDHINLAGCTATQPATGMDKEGNEILYFVSNRTQEDTGLDILYSPIIAGDFGPVKKHEVSTLGNDVTPFFHTPSQTLYFSSDRRTGLGGYDIYSFKNKTIKHEGYPLNSSFNDLYFTLDKTGNKGHFSSNRQGCIRLNKFEMGCDDIFAVDFININLKVLAIDDQNQPLLGTHVAIAEAAGENCSGAKENIYAQTNKEANDFYQPKLKKDAWYQIIASKEGYLSDTICFNTNGIKGSTDILKEVKLQPAAFELDLLALTFDENFNPPIPLSNCIVQLENMGTQEVYIKDNPTSNEFTFPILSNNEYCLMASATGYLGDTLCFDTYGLEKDASLVKNLFLKGDIIPLADLLPITLYFDNNYPDPGSWNTKTTSNYEDLFYPYIRKQGEFITNYTEGLRGADKLQKEAAISAFFENDLQNNYDTLGIFSEGLISFLKSGQTATISIRGYASPLAQSAYNDRLSSRRVDVLMNHFETYSDQVFQSYIGKQLFLEEVFFGEGEAPPTISYDPKDPRNAIYSPAASRERKVEIVGISIGNQSSN